MTGLVKRRARARVRSLPSVRCPSGKRRFAVRDHARKALRHLKATGDHYADRLRTYRCPDCDAWHVGHVTRWVRSA